MVALSLDCLTLGDTSPQDTIRSAAAAGFDLVSLTVQAPPVFPSMLVTQGNAGECMRLMADLGIRVHAVEAFELISVEAARAHRPAFELAGRLGASAIVAYDMGARDPAEAAQALAAMNEAAGEFGLATCLEPVAVGRTATLAQARDLIRRSGADAGIMFDTWHLIHSGCEIEELRAIEPGLIRYVQVNDGPLRIAEEDLMMATIGDRLYPGEGVFPLAELLALAPRDVPWGFECPNMRRVEAGMSPGELAREAMAAMRRTLAQLD